MVTIGIIDSGPAGRDGADGKGRIDAPVGAALRFDAEGAPRPARPDRLGHGTAVAAVLARALPRARLIHAQVFDDRPVTSALRVAAALDWLRGRGDVDLVCLSLGLAQDRAVLAQAVDAAHASGLVLVAAHPARGPSPYPAAYAGVIAATGDARCGWTDLSLLRPGLFGAWCNSPEQGRGGAEGRAGMGGMGGASLGTARLAGHIGALLQAGHPRDPAALCQSLAARVQAEGPERRRA